MDITLSPQSIIINSWSETILMDAKTLKDSTDVYAI